jgi:uncharacterized repeat protein (TIGR02543 family)
MYKAAVPFAGGSATVEYDEMETAPVEPSKPSVSSYIVTFYLNDGSGKAHAYQTVAHNGKAVSAAKPTRTDCDFDGWYAANAEAPYDFNSPVTADIKLYARWKPLTLSAVIAEMAANKGAAAKMYSLPSGDEAYNDAVTLTTANSPASVTIDGNGKVITGISNPFTVGSGVTLTLKNITFTRIQFIVSEGGTLVLDDGSIVRKNLTRSGVTVNGGTLEMRDGSSVTENGDSGICMKGAGGKFTMNGGTISGNHTADYIEGGGVRILGEGAVFTMNAGAISGNTAYRGGGVGIPGEGAAFTMNGGTISGNHASDYAHGGGGVGIWGSNNKFTITAGGTISGNTAYRGGGVTVSGTGSEFTMTGGEISGNSAEVYGGGVSVRGTGNEFTMTGGTISGNNASIGGGLYLHGGTLTGNPQIGGTTSPGAGKGWIHGNTKLNGNTPNDVYPAQ